ncbi:hypothetical protein ABW19_dt0209765 [Dactylella cylindrospora]|nr:hypothetical protein ABW19_dt0209765 [Dactylella cylindrospora]
MSSQGLPPALLLLASPLMKAAMSQMVLESLTQPSPLLFQRVGTSSRGMTTQTILQFASRPTRAVKSDDEDDKMYTIISFVMNKYYKEQIHYDYDGKLKDDMGMIDTCNHCPCNDYDDILQSRAAILPTKKCFCGHSYFQHSRKGEVEWLLKKFAAEFYGKVNNIEEDGTKKTQLSQIDKCDQCGCNDFDRRSARENKMCTCGHRWASHSRRPDKWFWIVILVSLAYVKGLKDDDEKGRK